MRATIRCYAELNDFLPRSRQRYDDDRRCTGCGRIYWKGTHYERLGRLLDAALRGRDA